MKTYQAVVNAGSGRARTSNEVAKALIAVHGDAKIEYVPFPADLDGRYQHFTEANLTSLCGSGCKLDFVQLEEGIRETFENMEAMAV